MKEIIRNPYIVALSTAIVARLTQWVSAFFLLKPSDWQFGDDLFFLNLAHAELRTTFIGINLIVMVSIIIMGFLYSAYVKIPGTESRNGLIALSSSLFLVVLHIIAALFFNCPPVASFSAAELGASMMRNFVIVVGCLYIGEKLYSLYE